MPFKTHQFLPYASRTRARDDDQCKKDARSSADPRSHLCRRKRLLIGRAGAGHVTGHSAISGDSRLVERALVVADHMTSHPVVRYFAKMARSR